MFKDMNTPSSTADTEPVVNQPNSMGDGQKKRRHQVKGEAAGKLFNSEINQFLKMVHARAKDASGKFVIARALSEQNSEGEQSLVLVQLRLQFAAILPRQVIGCS